MVVDDGVSDGTWLLENPKPQPHVLACFWSCYEQREDSDVMIHGESADSDFDVNKWMR